MFHLNKYLLNDIVNHSFAAGVVERVVEMPLQSPYPPLDIPKVNILSYIFAPDEVVPDTPLWIDSVDDSISLSLPQVKLWCKRIAIGLDRLGVKPGSVVMIYSPNHIFVPTAYLGIVGCGRIFSGTNPAYTLPGKSSPFS